MLYTVNQNNNSKKTNQVSQVSQANQANQQANKPTSQASEKMSNTNVPSTSIYELPDWPSNFQGFQGLIPIPLGIHQMPVDQVSVVQMHDPLDDPVPVEIYPLHHPLHNPEQQASQDEPTELIYALAKNLKMLKKGKDLILPVKKNIKYRCRNQHLQANKANVPCQY